MPLTTLMSRRAQFWALVLATSIPGTGIFAGPPGFSFQPTNLWIVPAGSDLVISMTATGSPPLTYSWWVNGLRLTAQTNDTLSLVNVQPANAGTYLLKVANLEGTNKSGLVRVAITVPNPVATPIALTDWNRDVVLENSDNAFAQAFDGPASSYALFEEGWKGHADGLPSSRQFVSAINYPSVLFELQPYNASNVLWLTPQPTTNLLTGTLTLVEPKPYVSISIAAASAFSATTPSNPGAFGSVVLNFSDGAHSGQISFLSMDWLDWGSVYDPSQGYGSTPIAGLGWVWATGTCCYGGVANGTDGQALYQTDINLLRLGLSGKPLASITFTGSTANGGANQSTSIFAVSGVAADLGPAPPQVLASKVTNQNAFAGGNLVLSVVAEGTPPVTYQWKRAGRLLGECDGPRVGNEFDADRDESDPTGQLQRESRKPRGCGDLGAGGN